jgi:hypothetical protein
MKAHLLALGNIEEVDLELLDVLHCFKKDINYDSDPEYLLYW